MLAILNENFPDNIAEEMLNLMSKNNLSFR